MITRMRALFLPIAVAATLLPRGTEDPAGIRGFTAESAKVQREWETNHHRRRRNKRRKAHRPQRCSNSHENSRAADFLRGRTTVARRNDGPSGAGIMSPN